MAEERSQFLDRGFLDSVLGQGLLMGQGDEAEAYLKSKVNNKSYEENLAALRRSYADYQKKFPGTAAVGELTGAMTPLLAAAFMTRGRVGVDPMLRKIGALQRILRGPGGVGGKIMRTAKRGALGGTGGYIGGDIAGGGYSEAPYRSPQYEKDREEARDSGAFFGALAAPILEPALQGVGKFLRRKFGSGRTTDQAVGDVLRSTTGGSQAARNMMDDVIAAQELNIPMVPMGVNRELETLADTIVTKGGEPKTVIRDTADEITTDAQGRISQRLNSVSPYSGQSYVQTIDAIAESRKAQAGPLYEKAFYELDVEGNPIMVGNRKKEIMITEADEGFDDITSYLQRPAFRNGLQRSIRLAQERGLDDEARDLASLLNRLQKGERPSISLRLFDRIKQGVDDEIRDSYKDFEPTELTGALLEAKDGFLKKLDELFPEYANARKVYSDKSAMLEAGREMKKKFNKMTPEEMEKFLNSLNSKAEKETAIMAAVDVLQNSVLNVQGGRNFAQMLGGNVKGGEALRAKIRLLFDGDVIKADNFEKAMMIETELYRRMNAIGGGSQTAGRGEAVQAYDELTSSNPKAAGIIFGDDGLVRKMARFFSGDEGSDEFQDQVSLKISELLSDGSPESLSTVVKLVDKASERADAKMIQDVVQPFGVGAEVANLSEAPQNRYLQYEE